MNDQQVPVEAWPERLEKIIEERCSIFRRVYLLRETDSTQDAARRMNAFPGDVFVAWKQTAGRGRLGRKWSSDEAGVAITFVIKAEPAERLSIAMAIGGARTVEGILGREAGIKWPNDIFVDDRKIAGILVEQSENLALPAIGLNVTQLTWPEELQDKAISLHQLGVEVDRIEVAEAIIEQVDRALGLSDEDLIEGFLSRDYLKGRMLHLRSGSVEVRGRHIRIDPMQGLAIQTGEGELWLPASTTTVIDFE